MENTAATSSLPPVVSQILAYVILILVVVLLIDRSRKKKGKPSLFSLLFGMIFKSRSKAKPKTSSTHSTWYGNYPKLITVDAFKKLSGKSYVVFDLETTGLDPDNDQIVEIGAVRVAGGVLTNQTFQQLVNPGIKMPAEASEVNHITDDMLKGQPRIKPTLADFLDFVDGDVLVAHNGGFDAAFLDNACIKCGYDAPKKYFDTMRLSVYWKKIKNRKLETFLKAAEIENDEAHRALSDAIATAKLCIKSMDKIK